MKTGGNSLYIVQPLLGAIRQLAKLPVAGALVVRCAQFLNHRRPTVNSIDLLIAAAMCLPKASRRTGIRFPWYFLNRERSTEARVSALRKLLAMHPEDIEVIVFLARMLSTRGEYGEATRLLCLASGLKWSRDYPGSDDASSRARGSKPPGFLIIGQKKAATSALFTFLCRHPQVVEPLVKEVWYFSNFPEAGHDWYCSHFPPVTQDSELMSGEASTSYFCDPSAPQRIRKEFPDTKLILLLREPVARAYSEYQMGVRTGSERRSWEQLVEAELEALPDIPFDQFDIELVEQTPAVRNYILLSSMTTPFLRHWLDVFSPDQLLILKTEEFKSDAQQVMNRVFQHLKLPPFKHEFIEQVNKGDYEVIDPAIEKRLRARFEGDQRATEKLLARRGYQFGA